MVETFKLPICLQAIDCCGKLLYPEKRQRFAKSLLTNSRPLSVNPNEDIPYGITQLFNNIVAICAELILAVGIPCVNFENLPDITTTR